MTAATRSLRAAVLLASLCACDETPQPAPTAPQRAAIEITGGAWITREELTAFDAYYDALDPTIGLRHRRAVLLERHLLPLALARAAFPALRDQALANARELASVAGNALALQRAGGEVLGPIARAALPVPFAAWARDQSVIGAVSPVLETPEAVFVVALLEHHPGFTPVGDELVFHVVRFPAHDQPDFAAWLQDERLRRKGGLLHCDPDVLPALPAWLAP